LLSDVVHDYNLHMGFVDQMDSGCLQYAYPHRLINWKHAVFFWLLEATIRNSWIIWNATHHGNEEDFQTFRRQLAAELRAKGLNLSTTCHGLVQLSKRRKCAVCLKIGRNSNTTLACAVCNFLPMHRKCYLILHLLFLRARTSTGSVISPLMISSGFSFSNLSFSCLAASSCAFASSLQFLLSPAVSNLSLPTLRL